jgi:HD-like signal output (HDOD) protein
MLGPEQYAVYRTVIKHVLNDSERLPSLPAITLKIRKAIGDSHTDAHALAQLIGKDPALSTLLIKSASSPLYRRAVPPKTLSDVIALLGFANVNSLVMVHSVRSLFVMRSPVMKKLFSHTWQRLVIKTSLASFFAQKLRYRPMDEAQMGTLLTEVGSLAVLSALVESHTTPAPETYFELCRHYSKSLGSVLLNKWNVDSGYVTVLKQSGNWDQTADEGIALIDIVNLSIYYAVLFTNKSADLPPLESLAAYAKLLERDRRCVKPNWLALVVENKAEIQEIVNTFR